MTPRKIFAALAAFFVLYVLCVYSVSAAPKWKDEVGIQSLCYDLQTIKDIVKAKQDGNAALGDELAARAFAEHDCVRLPVPAAAFKPTGLAGKYASFGGKPVTVIKGNLVMRDESLGREVYVLVPDHLVSNFQLAEPVDTRPKLGVEFDSWQDI